MDRPGASSARRRVAQLKTEGRTLPGRRAATLAVTLAVAMSAARTTSADATDECIAAAEAAQPLRADGHFRAAREKLLVCSRPGCPETVRSDCTKWLSAMEGLTPSIIVHALDGAGEDVVDVRVQVDGETVASRLDGKEIAIDPGEHVLRFDRQGSVPIEQKVVMRETEQYRVVSLTFRAAAASSAMTSVSEVRGAKPGPETPAAQRASLVGPISVLGAGTAMLGIAAYLWASGNADHATLQSTCAPSHTCSQSAVDSAHFRLVAGDLLGVSGVVLGALGAGWLIVGRTASPSATVGVQVGSGAATLDVHGAF
jgi:hypothetical protein